VEIHSLTRAKRRKKKTIQEHVYSLAEQIARGGGREKLRDALDAEFDKILGRGRYERREHSFQLLYRNGYHKSRCLVCWCGVLKSVSHVWMCFMSQQ
jgi:hypothetical protein